MEDNGGEHPQHAWPAAGDGEITEELNSKFGKYDVNVHHSTMKNVRIPRERDGF